MRPRRATSTPFSFRKSTKPKMPHVWTKVTGQRGRFVGIVQTMAGTGGLGFLEGDDQFR